MITTLTMIALNEPLAHWRRFERESRGQTVYHSGKNTDKTAQAIFRQLSHEEAVALVAKEFEAYPADLRLVLRTLCNGANCSGNVRKGIQRLDKLLNGKLLRSDVHEVHMQVMTRDGWKSQRVNRAVAGATRKYAVVK